MVMQSLYDRAWVHSLVQLCYNLGVHCEFRQMYAKFLPPFLITSLQNCSKALSGAGLNAKALVCLLGNSQLPMAKAHSLQQMRG